MSSGASRPTALAAIRSFARYVALCEPASLALVTRVLAIPRKRTTRRLVGYLTRAEMDACLAVPDRSRWTGRRDHALLLTLYNSGARVSELAALRRAEVTFGASPAVQLHGKGRKERVVPLWPRTARVLQAWFRELGGPADGVAFPNARGGRLTRHGIAYLLRRVVACVRPRCPSLATKQVSPHVVRHALAMHLLQAGVAPAVIALWLGHESVETTHMYVEADLTMKERALARLPAAGSSPRRFQASDRLLAFLTGL